MFHLSCVNQCESVSLLVRPCLLGTAGNDSSYGFSACASDEQDHGGLCLPWTADTKTSILVFYVLFLLHSDVGPTSTSWTFFSYFQLCLLHIKCLSASHLGGKLGLIRSWQFSNKRNKVSKILSSSSVVSYGPFEMMSANW